MSARELAELKTVIIRGKIVAASVMSVYDHNISEGEYIFEHGTIKPEQDPDEVPTWASLMFYPEGSDVPIVLGWGYAEATRFALVVKGPIPLSGPGYFRAAAISANTGDTVEGLFSYRKVKRQ